MIIPLRPFNVRDGSARRSLLTALTVMAILAVSVMIPGDVWAQAKVGTTGAQFLELGVSARAMGMAESFVAVSDDVSAVYYNPAGLTSLWGKEVSATYVDMPADVGHSFAAIGLPMESIGGVLGIAAYALSSGEMIVRDHYHGEFGGSGQTFGYNAFSLGISYGRYLTDRFSIGLTVKYIGEYVHDYTANGWAADVGTSYDTGYRGFKIGMAITNFGPDMKFIKKAYPLPINFRFGSCINIVEQMNHKLTIAAEGSHPSDNLEKYNTGLEYTFMDRFILRGGGRINYDVDGFTVGGGFRQPYGEDGEIGVDYAFQDFGILTEVHRFSLLFAF